jgi:hypothetical protein
LIRDNDTGPAEAKQMRLRSTPHLQQAELLAAATETVNRIVSALAKARVLALA